MKADCFEGGDEDKREVRVESVPAAAHIYKDVWAENKETCIQNVDLLLIKAKILLKLLSVNLQHDTLSSSSVCCHVCKQHRRQGNNNSSPIAWIWALVVTTWCFILDSFGFWLRSILSSFHCVHYRFPIWVSAAAHRHPQVWKSGALRVIRVTEQAFSQSKPMSCPLLPLHSPLSCFLFFFLLLSHDLRESSGGAAFQNGMIFPSSSSTVTLSFFCITIEKGKSQTSLQSDSFK